MRAQHDPAPRPVWRTTAFITMLIAIVLTACGEPVIPAAESPERLGTPRAALGTQAATPVATFDLPGADPRLAALRTTHSITITDSSGSSFGAHVSGASYYLARVGDGFAGEGRFTVTGYRMGGGGNPALTHMATRQAMLPMAAATTFLQQLASTPPLERPYAQPSKPSHWGHSIRIALGTDAGIVEFVIDPYPTSTPLSTMKHAGLSWTSISRQPLDALDAIEPHLRMYATLNELQQRVSHDVSATQVAIPTPTLVPPMICRTPSPTPRVSAVATASVSGTLPPGAEVQIGDTINIAEYFGLPVPATRQVDISAETGVNQKISDPQRTAAITDALNRPAIVVPHPRETYGRGLIMLLVDLFGRSLGLGYFTQGDLIAFSTTSGSYAIAAPPEFRALLAEQLCQR